MDLKNSSEFEGETSSERFMRKVEEAPIVPVGIAACVSAVIYGIYQYKNRGSMSTSVYLMKFRVIAQGAVVCTLGFGVGLSVFSQLFKNKKVEEAKKD